MQATGCCQLCSLLTRQRGLRLHILQPKLRIGNLPVLVSQSLREDFQGLNPHGCGCGELITSKLEWANHSRPPGQYRPQPRLSAPRSPASPPRRRSPRQTCPLYTVSASHSRADRVPGTPPCPFATPRGRKIMRCTRVKSGPPPTASGFPSRRSSGAIAESSLPLSRPCFPHCAVRGRLHDFLPVIPFLTTENERQCSLTKFDAVREPSRCAASRPVCAQDKCRPVVRRQSARRLAILLVLSVALRLRSPRSIASCALRSAWAGG